LPINTKCVEFKETYLGGSGRLGISGHQAGFTLLFLFAYRLEKKDNSPVFSSSCNVSLQLNTG
jgi:hypothetical protein